MSVECNPQFALRGILGDALQQRVPGRQFHRDMVGAQRLGHVPDVIVFLVGHVHGGRQLESVDGDAGVIVHLAEGFVLVHRYGKAPVLRFRRGLLHFGSSACVRAR